MYWAYWHVLSVLSVLGPRGPDLTQAQCDKVTKSLRDCFKRNKSMKRGKLTRMSAEAAAASVLRMLWMSTLVEVCSTRASCGRKRLALVEQSSTNKAPRNQQSCSKSAKLLISRWRMMTSTFKRIVGHVHSEWGGVVRWGGCCFSTVVVGRVGQRGGGGCGLGVHTECLALTHIYTYIHTSIYFSRIQIWLHDLATFWYSLIPCIMRMFLCSGVVKYILTMRGGSKSIYISIYLYIVYINMNHSRRAGFSDSKLPGKTVEKSRKHALRCDSASQKSHRRACLRDVSCGGMPLQYTSYRPTMD